MQEGRPSSRAQIRVFAQNFFKHPRMLGALLPSSSFVVERLLRQMDWRRAQVVVEYGPGVGTFTTEMLRHMRPDAQLLVIDTNTEFISFLRETIPDRRLTAIHGSAADVQTYLTQRGLSHADYIISGIPFSTMPDAVRQQILDATYAALQPDGAFLVYQYTRAVQRYLSPLFGSIQQDFEWRNLMPVRFFFCRKQAEQQVARSARA